MSIKRRCTIHNSPEQVNIIVPERKRFLRKNLPKKIITFAWLEVSRVIAFKRDQWAVDRICMVFELNGTETIEIHEEMEGWTALLDAMPLYLSGALKQEEWFGQVAFPAFKLCLTEIYHRPAPL